MFKFVIILAVIACALGASLPAGLTPQLDGRIVGGANTNIVNFPWQTSLQRNGGHFCGGSIYSSKIIVTAAHCVQYVSANILKVRAGSSFWNSGGTLISVATIRYHEGYNPSTMVNDIAILRLSSNLNFNANVRAIDMARSKPANDAAAVVSGWGTTSYGGGISAQLQYVNLRIVSQSACASSTYGYGSEVRKTMICAYATNKDACQGDAGGPLVTGSVLVGVVSWGYGCALPNYPGVYADVASLRSWIISNAKTISAHYVPVCFSSSIRHRLCIKRTTSRQSTDEHVQNRIVGGENVTISSYPWQVSIQRSGAHICGGTIYFELIIITAAHCLLNITPTLLKIRVGSTYYNQGDSLIQVAKFKYHEGFNTITMDNVIAVVRLEVALKYGLSIKPITLTTINPANGATAVVTGWGVKAYGTTELSTTLQYVYVKIIESSVCASSAYGYGNLVQSNMICANAEGKDACQYDSGGSLVSDNALVGVVSWGFGCAYGSYPGVYANVANLRSWIISAANNV